MKVLACCDGSDVGKHAVLIARKYAKRFSAELHVVTSLPRDRDVDLNYLSKQEEAKKMLSSIKDEAHQDDVNAVVSLLANELTDGENLIQYADEQGVDVIVIGVRKTSKVGKLLFGSTAQYVILNASCPVLSVKLGCKSGF